MYYKTTDNVVEFSDSDLKRLQKKGSEGRADGAVVPFKESDWREGTWFVVGGRVVRGDTDLAQDFLNRVCPPPESGKPVVSDMVLDFKPAWEVELDRRREAKADEDKMRRAVVDAYRNDEPYHQLWLDLQLAQPDFIERLGYRNWERESNTFRELLSAAKEHGVLFFDERPVEVGQVRLACRYSSKMGHNCNDIESLVRVEEIFGRRARVKILVSTTEKFATESIALPPDERMVDVDDLYADVWSHSGVTSDTRVKRARDAQDAFEAAIRVDPNAD